MLAGFEHWAFRLSGHVLHMIIRYVRASVNRVFRGLFDPRVVVPGIG